MHTRMEYRAVASKDYQFVLGGYGGRKFSIHSNDRLFAHRFWPARNGRWGLIFINTFCSVGYLIN